jgi:hypothetical protein
MSEEQYYKTLARYFIWVNTPKEIKHKRTGEPVLNPERERTWFLYCDARENRPDGTSLEIYIQSDNWRRGYLN